ncbi:PaaX family transcriptional regulator C-terminal domain-containing protein [Streptomyces sp. T-3]|nr:PaaX family transcriptional regulator C-terminal domain-containing protein [Streptomyces sp. T-3]
MRDAVSSCWDFPAIEEQYADFTDTYGPVPARLGRQTDIDHAEALRHYVPMLTRWRALPYLDPGLPCELLPPDRNAVAARQVFQQLHAVLAEPSLRHIQSTTGGRPQH